MAERKTVRIFISSPSDVRPERAVAERLLAKLDRDLHSLCSIEPILWERQPLTATKHFQDAENIPPPRTTDIVVVILWSRLGFPLPYPAFQGAVSGRQVTGTQWEFEDAYAASQASEHGRPHLLVYRKQAPVAIVLGDQGESKTREQKASLDAFVSEFLMNEDGTFRLATHEFQTLSEFEKLLEGHLRALVVRMLGDVPEVYRARWQHGSPYRGLEAFELEHAQVYFGRHQVRNALRVALAEFHREREAFVLLVGASGSGKSSLLKAGVLPDLLLPGMLREVGLVRWAETSPSGSSSGPLESLAHALEAPHALGSPFEVEVDPDTFADAVRGRLLALAEEAHLSAPWQPLLCLVVDQLEELFADDIQPETRARYVAVLGALSRSGHVVVMATMRNDFFAHLEAIPELASLSSGSHLVRLGPPTDTEIAEIITEPAREAGLVFERDPSTGTSLSEVIRAEAAGAPGALPLLEFTLDQLWQQRSEDGLLTFAAYHALGGLLGAVGRRAEQVFSEQPSDVQRALGRVLFALSRIDAAEHRVLARRVPDGTFPPGTPEARLVDALAATDTRLVVRDDDRSIRVAHEALLSHWSRAAQRIQRDRGDIELRGRLEAAAAVWRDAAGSRRDDLLLHRGFPLNEARALVQRRGDELPSGVVAYVRASQRAVRQERLRLARRLLGAALLAPVVAVIALAVRMNQGVDAVEPTLRFTAVPAGCFSMGSPEDEEGREPSEGPIREVCLEAFEIGTFEVTRDEWRQVMVHDADPAHFKTSGRLPVEDISWHDATRFALALSTFGEGSYRLPSEAEWEYAARGGSAARYPWGAEDAPACEHANVNDLSSRRVYPDEVTFECDDHVVHTAEVGRFRPNAFGLHDVIGNVSEWVRDCFGAYEGAPTDETPVEHTGCAERVARGGSWYSYPRNLRSAGRRAYAPDYEDKMIGFRLVRTHSPPR